MLTERRRAMLEAMGVVVWPMPGQVDLAVPQQPPDGWRGEPDAEAAAPLSTARGAPPATQAVARGAEARLQPMATRQVASASWAELREAVAGCRLCGLCETRTQTVFGVGHERAHWMIVGEAPGENEDRQGEPFVGKAGQLLDNMLRAIGLGRGPGTPAQQVFIANTLKCRPPANRNPEPAELARCEPYLQRQIALVQPRIIVAMGRFAVQSLLRSSEPIGRLRGRVHAYAGVPLVVTYHPAYLLRSPQDKARAWDDLCLALDVLAATPAG